MSRIDEILADARSGMERVEPEDLPRLQAEGACVIDIRTEATRVPEGDLPGALVIDRLVLEWRLDPDGREHPDLDPPALPRAEAS